MNTDTLILFMFFSLTMMGGMTAILAGLWYSHRESSRTLSDIRDLLREGYGLPPQKRGKGESTGIKATLVLVLVVPCVWGGSPNSALATVYKDLQSIPPQDRPYVRWQTIYHIHDNKERLEYRQALDFALNSLSRSRKIYRVVPVDIVVDDKGKVTSHATLFRFDLRWYQMPSSVWEKLTDSEVYFHRDAVLDGVKEGEKVHGTEETPVEYEWKKVEWEGGDWKNADGTTTYYEKGAFSYQKRVPKTPPQVKPDGKETIVPGTWLDARQIGAIYKATHSECPIVRADWFIVQSFQQDERDGVGYYDFLQIKSRDDLDKLAALDRKLVDKEIEEVRAIIPISNVAVNNRQVTRLATVRGGAWFSLDTIRQKKRKDNLRRNAQRNLEGDFVHDAEEGYVFLPNRLFALWAGDVKGNRQDSVPPNVAGDKSTFIGNDVRIHPRNCVFCHKEGLRPLNDWGRRVYRVNSVMKLVGPIPAKQERLQILYLSNLERELKLDQDRYAEALWEACELKPDELATVFKKVHDRFLASTLGAKDVAMELGVTQAHLLASLKKYALYIQKHQGKGLDPSLVGLLAVPEERMRREYFEEVFAQANDVAMGTVFVGEPYREVVGPPRP